MEAPSLSQRGAVSLFDVRHNWKHLTNRPALQEPVIDGVRAIAILWVVVLHMVLLQFALFPLQATAIFTYPATSWVRNGTLGVDLFFVISGFLIGSILFAEMKKSGNLILSRFYVRRFLRLIPVYTAAMVLALYFLHNLPLRPKWGHAENAWANILYVNNFLPYMKQYMGWCWSLAIEEQFYLLLPACILLFLGLGKGRVRILVGLMVLSVAIRYTGLSIPPVSSRRTALPRSRSLVPMDGRHLRQAMDALWRIAGRGHRRIPELLLSAAIEAVLRAYGTDYGAEPGVHRGNSARCPDGFVICVL